MIHPDFLRKLKNLPAETPITESHVHAIIATVSSLLNKETDVDAFSNSLLMANDDSKLSQSINLAHYSVGKVRAWLDSQVSLPASLASDEGLSRLEIANELTSVSSLNITFPLMLTDRKLTDFFTSIQQEAVPAGFRVIGLINNSALRWPALPKARPGRAEKILKALDEFNKTIITNPAKARETYGEWESKMQDSVRLGYFSSALAFNFEMAQEMSTHFPVEFISEHFNPAEWVWGLLTQYKEDSLNGLDLQSAFKHLISLGVDINKDYLLQDVNNEIIFSGTVAHLLANTNSEFFDVANFTQSYQEIGALTNELITLGLDVDKPNSNVAGINAREMGNLIIKKSGHGASTFITALNNHELHAKLSAMPEN
jgi:hypothetical protein